MKIAILGAGAMGSAFAWLLRGKNREIVLYDKSRETVEQIEKRGLTVFAGGERHNIKPAISTSPEVVAETSMVLVLVKSYSTEELMGKIKEHLAPKTIILSLQNGLGNREIMESHADFQKILMGSTTVGATKTSPCTVELRGMGDVILEQKPPHSSIVEKIFTSSGIKTTISENTERVLLEKAILNSAINCLGAIFKVKNGDLIKNSHSLAIMDSIIEEITSLPSVMNMGISSKYMKEKTRNVCQKTKENRCSMLQDLDNGRQTEIDFINGYFLKVAEHENMELPVNSTLVNAVKVIEGKNHVN